MRSNSIARLVVVVLCGVAQNIATGFAFGSFGPLLASTEQHFAVSRTVATTGMSVVTATTGILALLLGGLMGRAPTKPAMVIAALVSAIGYWGLALAPSFGFTLPMYALIGAGVCVLSILGPATIVGRLFDSGRGKVLGLINLPIVLFALPFTIAQILPHVGRSTVLGGMGTIQLMLAALLLFFLVEKNQAIDGRQEKGNHVTAIEADATPLRTDGRLTMTEALHGAPFWFVSIAIGVLNASGSAFVVHIVPFGMEEGLSPEKAAALLSLFAAAGLLGAPLFGWIIDQLGGPATMALNAAIQALLWLCILNVSGPALYATAALLGLCAVPINVLHQATMSEMLESKSVSRGIGLSYVLKLPFIFSFAPLVAYLFERSGGYWLPFVATSGALGFAMIMSLLAFTVLRRATRQCP
jgi:MFS family permease